jgi:hypothetical protein
MHIPKLDGVLDLTICQAMTADLEAYLGSDLLYWPVAQSTPLGARLPQLTIGGLLEHLMRAEAASDDLTSKQDEVLRLTQASLDRIRAAHRAAYTAKALREIDSRLKIWSNYLDDYARQPAEVAAYYPHEVRTRAKLDRLLQELGREVPAAAHQQLERLDNQLRISFVPGAFVWDPRLQAAFPHDRCWWLYGYLPD